MRTTVRTSAGSIPAAASSAGSRPGTGAQLAASESAGPMPASTSVTGPSPVRTANARNRSHHRPSAVTAPGSSRSAAAQCAWVAPGNASPRGWKKGPSPSDSAVTVIDPRVRLRGIAR
ncbi:hypothetical protein [Micromonospora sp. CMU55-4]|uniref:hypothetical protein n=1 Tax=Micromonospora sp. CMU55-4 TaxID=2717028 RepID=UPI00281533C6|nr:hypothetical protein [Micromonospora sp. CMU55-4]